jgi:hypothetical protein
MKKLLLQAVSHSAVTFQRIILCFLNVECHPVVSFIKSLVATPFHSSEYLKERKQRQTKGKISELQNCNFKTNPIIKLIRIYFTQGQSKISIATIVFMLQTMRPQCLDSKLLT